uniref:Uncharacterized protein n=1 Tax=Anguilla anguilla TaxID=7936 RepID=A0A0E9TN30_ANGAN
MSRNTSNAFNIPYHEKGICGYGNLIELFIISKDMQC